MTVELPAGIQHGTPEGFAAGCRREKDCPALHTHGMCCLFAHVRAETDPRYFRAKVRDPRPEAIAQRLGIKPPRPAAAAFEEQLDEEAEARSGSQVYQPGRGWHKRPADQAPVKKPEPRSSAESEAPSTPPINNQSRNPETTVNTTTEQPVYDFAARCADAISTAAGRKKIRDWARGEGFEVPSHGRIPGLYVRSYVQAQDDSTSTATPTPEPPAPKALDEAADAQPIEGTITVDGPPVVVSSAWPPAEEEAPDAFRPDWAGVTIPADIRDARLTAARLEEDNARLQAERDEAVEAAREVTQTLAAKVTSLEEALQAAVNAPPPDDGATDPLVADALWQLTASRGELAIAHRALELTLLKLDEERQARVTEVADRETQIGKLISDRKRLIAANRIQGTIIEQAHATITRQSRALRAAELTATRPFWRRRR
ncbi:MAG: hypothetical protein K0S37_3004 [Microbacterium sp.]|nr:hypothetical protein [Microbacterium sp.]